MHLGTTTTQSDFVASVTLASNLNLYIANVSYSDSMSVIHKHHVFIPNVYNNCLAPITASNICDPSVRNESHVAI